MRLVLALAVLAFSAASAQAAEDRYGPSRATAAGAAMSAQPYTGATLMWSGKVAPVAPQAVQATATARPAPIAGGLYRTPPPAPTVPMTTAPTAAFPPGPVRYAPPPAAAPTSLYSRPVAQAPVDRLPPPPSPTAVQGGAYASTGPRFYSVHRPYGETPDPIPAAPQGERMAYRPEASLAGAVSLSGVGDGVRDPDAMADDGMAGVGAADAQEEEERAAKRELERAAARRAAASAGR